MCSVEKNEFRKSNKQQSKALKFKLFASRINVAVSLFTETNKDCFQLLMQGKSWYTSQKTHAGTSRRSGTLQELFSSLICCFLEFQKLIRKMHLHFIYLKGVVTIIYMEILLNLQLKNIKVICLHKSHISYTVFA